MPRSRTGKWPGWSRSPWQNIISVQEKREARATGKTSAKKQTAGNAGQSGGQSAGEDEEKLTWFEKRVLKPVNDALG